jgi:hypothetical protein
MEFFPMFREIECSPATGNLREVRRDGVYVGVSCRGEEGTRIEWFASLRWQLEVFLLV